MSTPFLKTTPLQTTFVLGGARSGKSRFAASLAGVNGFETVFIATAQALDAEMAARIGRHRAERPRDWRVLEEPVAIVAALERERGPGRVVIIDCLTLWLANLMSANLDVEAATDILARELAIARGPVVLVSNEVGFGIVPDTPLGRRFRDAQGLLNQAVARACARVVLVVAGLPLELKATPARG